MAAKRPDLRQALKPLSNSNTPVRAAPEEKPETSAKSRHYRPSREGMENVTGYFPPAVKSQLMELAIRRRKERGGKVTIQDLLAEALNDLFAKSGMPEIAPITRRTT